MRRGHLRRQASVDYPRYPPANSTTQQPPPETLAMLASDYDSEAQDYAIEYPAALPPINRTRDQLNLSVIQQHNPEVTAILSVASHVTVYEWAQSPAPGWQKSGVEGALFICKLKPGQYNEERFRAIVLNRGGLDNFEAELRQSGPEGVEIVQELVIISRNEGGERKANGIYIFCGGPGTSTEHSRAANAELMRDLAIAAQRSRVAAEQHLSEAQNIHTTNVHLPVLAPGGPLQSAVNDRRPSPMSRRDADDTDENMLFKMFQQATKKPTPVPIPTEGAAEALMNALRQPVPGPQASPSPQIAPTPTRKVDLLALLQGGQSDTEAGLRAGGIPQSVQQQYNFPHNPAYNAGTPQQATTRPPNNDLLNLFRGAGLA